MQTQAREALTQILEQAWKRKDTSVLHDIYHPESRIEGILPEATVSVQELCDLVDQFNMMVDVLDWEFVHDFCDGTENHYARLNVKVRLNASGRTAWFNMVNCTTMRDGRMSGAYIQIDALTFLEKIGLMPQGSLYIAFAGGSFS